MKKDIASLKFHGNLLISVDSKASKRDIWINGKKRRLPEEFKLDIFNLIFKKASLKALQFEEELNLPPHIPLPSLNQLDKRIIFLTSQFKVNFKKINFF